MDLWSTADAHEHLLLLRNHHAIFDGQSVCALLTELLQGGPEVASESGEIRLAPAIDEFMRLANSGTPKSVGGWSIPHACKAALSARQTRYQRVRLDAALLHRLKTRASTDGLDLNALLGAAVVRAAHDAGLCDGPVDFKTAVSLRAYVPADTIRHVSPSCYLSVANTVLEAGTASLKEIAAKYQRALLVAITSQAWRRSTVSPDLLHTQMQAVTEATAFSSFGMTNLGEVELRSFADTLEVIDFLPLTRRVAGHHAFAMHVAEFRSELGATFVYTSPLVTAAMINRIATAFANALRSYADGVNFVERAALAASGALSLPAQLLKGSCP